MVNSPIILTLLSYLGPPWLNRQGPKRLDKVRKNTTSAALSSHRKAVAPPTQAVAKARAAVQAPYRWFWDSLDQYLLQSGLKQTKQRRAIVERFINLKSHVSAERLHADSRDGGLSVGLATIYRTLNLLADAGLVEQKQFGDGHFVYEIRTPGSHHDHLICLDCGAVIEFENEEIERLQEKVAAAHGFQLTSHRLDLFGHCRKEGCVGRDAQR